MILLHYLKKYKFTITLVAVIWFLSLMKTPHVELADEIDFFDKWVHLLMYATLCAVLWWEYLRNHTVINKRKVFLYAVLAPICMSGCIELAQAYCTTYRSGDWFDFVANSLGVLLGAAVGYYGIRRWCRATARRNK